MRPFISRLIGLGALIASTGIVNAQYFDCCPQYDDSASNSTFFVEGDALVWKPSVHGIPFGRTIITNSDTTFDAATVEYTKVNKPDFTWNAGFRVGIGYHLPCAGDAKVVWTRFNSNARGCSFIPANVIGNFEPAYGSAVPQSSDLGTETTVFARWKLKLNLLDFKFEKRINLDNFVVTPFAAIRAAWIQQCYSIDIANSNTTTLQNSEFVRLKTQFQGAGLRAGVEGAYNIACGFGIYGFGSASILYGQFRNCNRDHIIENDTTTPTPINRDYTDFLRDRFNDAQVIGDCGAGIQWKTSLCEDNFALTLQAGWEQNVFFNLVRFDQNTGNSQINEHNLSLQGFTFSAKLDF